MILDDSEVEENAVGHTGNAAAFRADVAAKGWRADSSQMP